VHPQTRRGQAVAHELTDLEFRPQELWGARRR
jgi:hypothetical protein